MAQRRECMFDTVIFNRVLDDNVAIELLTECVDVFATHVQWDELCKTQSPERLNNHRLKVGGFDCD